jgi:hypothetical protein
MGRMVVVGPRDVGGDGGDGSCRSGGIRRALDARCLMFDIGMLDARHWNARCSTLERSTLNTGTLDARRWNARRSTLEHGT